MKKLRNKNKLAILIHGWGNNGSSAFFPSLKKNLESKGYLTFSPDLPNTENQSFEESSKVIEKLIAKYPDSTLSLIGHSMGGYIAIKLAEKFLLENLILIAPTSPLSKWSEERLKNVNNWLYGEKLENYLNFHNQEINFNKAIKNSKNIELIFGLKDPYIDKTNRNFFINNLDKRARYKIFEKYGHMGNSDGIVQFEYLENLF